MCVSEQEEAIYFRFTIFSVQLFQIFFVNNLCLPLKLSLKACELQILKLDCIVCY